LASGVKDVLNLGGGMDAWRGAGFDVERDGSLAR
jgi:rhodanese-related sulfurtransferase